MAYVEAVQSFATDRHQTFQKGTVLAADDPVVARFPKFFREFVALPGQPVAEREPVRSRRARG